MKYIRTKDRIYDINTIGFDRDSANKSVFGWYKIDCSVIYRRNIIKQADTIKELCDEFLFESFTTNKGLAHFKAFCCNNKWYDSISLSPLLKADKQKIKGAIWTDKGLIYVAKMNEKGCLELI